MPRIPAGFALVATVCGIVLSAAISGCEREPAAEVGLLSESAEDPTVTIECVRAEDGAPCPGVTAHAYENLKYSSARDEYGQLSIFPVIDCERLGTRIESDARGVVAVPLPEGRLDVLLRAGDRRGFVDLTTDSPRSLRVGLEPVPSFPVRVVDREGRPAPGVPVGIGFSVEPRSDALRTALTDERGLALVPDLDLITVLSAPKGELMACVTFPHRRPHATAIIDPREPGPEPLRLELPACGRIDVEVRDDSGALAPIDGSITLRPLGAVQPITREWITAPVTGGRARFPHVGIQLQVRLTAELHERRSISIDIAGPGREGEHVTALVPAVDPGPYLVGRFVDEAGRPLAHRTIEAETVHFDTIGECGISIAHRFGTDSEGRFRVSLHRGRFDEDDFHKFEARVLEPPGTHRGTVEVRMPGVVDQVVDLEDLRTPLLSEIVSGRVFLDDGSPADGVELRLVSLAEPWLPRWTQHPDLLSAPSATTDESGRFVFRAEAAPPSCAISTERNAGSIVPQAPVPFAPRETGVQIQVMRFGGCVGSLVVEAEASHLDFRVVLRPRGETIPFQPRVFESGLEDEFGFSFWAVPPGQYDFEVLLGTSVVTTVEDVRILPNDPYPSPDRSDPRLFELPVKIDIPRVELIVKSESGELIEDGVIHAPSEYGRPGNQLARIRHGRATIWSDQLPIDVEVIAPGCLSESISDLSEDTSVVLEPGVPVRFRVSADELPIRLMCLVIVQAQHGEILPPRFIQAPLDERGEAFVRLPREGVYEVTLYAEPERDVARRPQVIPIDCGSIDSVNAPNSVILESEFGANDWYEDARLIEIRLDADHVRQILAERERVLRRAADR